MLVIFLGPALYLVLFCVCECIDLYRKYFVELDNDNPLHNL